MIWHINRTVFSACLLAVLAAAHAQAASIDRSVEFRDQYKSVPLLEYIDFSTRVKPWKPDEKTAVGNLIAEIKDRHPNLFARLTAVRPLRLYRVDKFPFRNPGVGGYSEWVKNGIILPDMTVADIMKSQGKGADEETRVRNIATIAHEMAHLIDQEHLTSSKAWLDLINPRLTAFRKALGADWQVEDQNAELARRTYGFPTNYAATSPVEAFCEYVGFMAALPEDQFPEDIMAFIHANVFAKASPEDATLFAIARALSAGEKGDLETAKRSLDALLTKSPNLVVALSVRSKLLINEQNFEAAISDLSHVLSLAEKMNLGAGRMSKLRTERGDVYVKFKKRELALADFTAALEADPEYVKALRSRANLFIDYYKPKEALSDIDVALKLQPKDWQLIYMRGIAHKQDKQYEQAINDFNRIFQLESAKKSPILLAEILAHRASAYGYLGRHREAAEDYSKALKADPTKKYVRMNMGWAYFLAQDFQKADRVFTAILSSKKISKSRRGEIYTKRYKTREQMKRYAEAADDAAKVMELTGPWNAHTYVAHADLLRLAKKYDEAIQAYTDLLKLYGEKWGYAPSIYGRIGQIKRMQKQYEAALQDLNKALRLKADYARMYMERGIIYRFLGKDDLADQDFQNAINKSKAYPDLLKNMKGWVKDAKEGNYANIPD